MVMAIGPCVKWPLVYLIVKGFGKSVCTNRATEHGYQVRGTKVQHVLKYVHIQH